MNMYYMTVYLLNKKDKISGNGSLLSPKIYVLIVDQLFLTNTYVLKLCCHEASETGGSSPMELEGAKKAFAYLISVGLKIPVFVLDRHRGIAKWIREWQPNTAHYFDIWHVARSIGKAMLKLSKQKGCKRIGNWMKGVRNHLYWCATSTKQGF